MTAPPAVIDTNVVISDLIGRESGSPTTVILDAMLGGRFTYLLSLDLLPSITRLFFGPRSAGDMASPTPRWTWS